MFPPVTAIAYKAWSADFAEMLGNFQHNPEHAPRMLRAVEEMTSYFRDQVRLQMDHPREGLVHSLTTAEVDGDRLSEDEVVATCIVTMVGGLETTTNLIGNGVLTLLRNPEETKRLREDISLVPSAVEEMLRYESPSQHTGRLAPADVDLGGRSIHKGQAVMAVMAAANRDPQRFPDPDRFDITRTDNRHLAFGYAAHFCFGAALARVEGQEVFEAIMRRLQDFRNCDPHLSPGGNNLGLRGIDCAAGEVPRLPRCIRAAPSECKKEPLLSEAKPRLLELQMRRAVAPETSESVEATLPARDHPASFITGASRRSVASRSDRREAGATAQRVHHSPSAWAVRSSDIGEESGGDDRASPRNLAYDL